MKIKTVTAVLSSLVIVALIVGILAIMSSMDKNDTVQPSTGARAGVDDGDIIAADNPNPTNGNYVSSAGISGYTMQCTDNRLNIYEMYDNGHRELIQTVDINAAVLPDEDRAQLEQGITTESYAKICSMIEDFSS